MWHVSCRCLESYHEALSFPPFIESSVVRIEKLLEYVVRWFGDIVRSIVPVPSHHKSEAGTRTNVSDNSFDNVIVVSTSLTFVGFSVQTELFLAGVFFSCGLLVIEMTP